jgi:putative intracellular protease/amidase
MKTNHFIYLMIVSLIAFTGFSQGNEKKTIDKKKILIVASNTGTFNGQKNGTYFVEIVPPFARFTSAGYEIDIVTPLGGQVAIYGDSPELVSKFPPDSSFQKKSVNSLKPEEVQINQYDAVYIPGGYGQFVDVCFNEKTLQLIARTYENGVVIGSAGHGTATLSKVFLKSGEPLVKGKTLTSFPTYVEKNHMFVADYGKKLPFDMEDELIKNGAILKVCAGAQSQNCLVTDKENRFVTGSFADSADNVAKEMLKLLTN